MTDLIYIPETHEYRLGDRPVPGVTRVLSDLGYYGDTSWFTRDSRELGNAVHKACFFVDRESPEAVTLEDALDVFAALHTDIHGYLAAYLLFKREYRYRAEISEFPVCSRKLRVAGTPDSLGSLGGFRALVDLKTWDAQGRDPKRASEIQTALYLYMAVESRFISEPEADKAFRYVLKLNEDGTYRCYQCQKASDIEYGIMAVRLWWDRYEHKLVQFRNGNTGDSL